MKAVCSSQFQLAVTVFIVRLKINLGVLRQKLFLEKRFQLYGAHFYRFQRCCVSIVSIAQGFLTYGVLLGVPPSSGTLILRTRINDATHKSKHWFNEKDV